LRSARRFRRWQTLAFLIAATIRNDRTDIWLSGKHHASGCSTSW